jgi:hypothetical protein
MSFDTYAYLNFHEQLLLSAALTLDPKEADLFFVPFYAS